MCRESPRITGQGPYGKGKATQEGPTGTIRDYIRGYVRGYIGDDIKDYISGFIRGSIRDPTRDH